jgi:predicted  nucleic acid-binding Zn-ribbon protein
MEGTMNEFVSLADLLDLQALDSRIDLLIDQRANVPELVEYKELHGAVAGITGVVAELTEQVVEVNSELRVTETELERIESKLNLTEQRLFAGGMNAKQSENMRLEVRQLKDQISTSEDNVLAKLDARELLEAELVTQGRDLEAKSARKAELESKIKGEWKAIDSEVARKEERKKELSASIDPDLIVTYDKIRKQRNGVAIGALENGVCGACHVTISTAEIFAMKKDAMPRCIHCARLLVL